LLRPSFSTPGTESSPDDRRHPQDLLYFLAQTIHPRHDHALNGVGDVNRLNLCRCPPVPARPVTRHRACINQGANYLFKKEGVALGFLYYQPAQTRGQVFNLQEIMRQLGAVHIRERCETNFRVMVGVVPSPEVAQLHSRGVSLWSTQADDEQRGTLD